MSSNCHEIVAFWFYGVQRLAFPPLWAKIGRIVAPVELRREQLRFLFLILDKWKQFR